MKSIGILPLAIVLATPCVIAQDVVLHLSPNTFGRKLSRRLERQSWIFLSVQENGWTIRAPARAGARTANPAHDDQSLPTRNREGANHRSRLE